MKKLFLMAALCCMSVGAFAQHEAGTFTLQPKFGMNVANITGDDIDGAKAKVGFVAGAEAEYQFSDMISGAVGVLWSQQGCMSKYDNVLTGKKDKAFLDYINVPVVCNVYVAKGLAVKAGVQFGFQLNDDIKSDGNKMGEWDGKEFDFSIPVGLSYEYSNVVLDARYNWGLTKTDDYKTHNSVFQFTLGYKFAL